MAGEIGTTSSVQHTTSDVAEVLPVQIAKETPEPAVLRKVSSRSTTSHVLSFLAFEGHSIRLGLEVTACIVLFLALRQTLELLDLLPKWGSLSAWFFSCIVVAILDHVIFLRPFIIFKQATALDTAAHHHEALAALERIAPDRGNLVCYPEARYHLQRAFFLIHCENYDLATYELELARNRRLSRELYHIARVILMKSKEDFTAARAEIASARAVCGNTSPFALEEALLLFEERSFQQAERGFSELLKRSAERHISGILLQDLAAAFHEASRLWTGHAEEALSNLSRQMRRLISIYPGIEAHRPYLTRLYYERAYYYATHREPDFARADLQVGSLLCKYQGLRQSHNRVLEELAWRYPTSV